MNQMVQEDQQMRINQMRREKEIERQKIQEAIYLSKKEEVKQLRVIQLQNKQRKNVYFT